MRETEYRLKRAEEHSAKAIRSMGRRAEFHAAMAAKWKEAAYVQGLPVPPDPPESK